MDNACEANKVGTFDIQTVNRLFAFDGLEIFDMCISGNVLTLSVRSSSRTAFCPYCGSCSEKVKSRYQRCLQGFPISNFQISLKFHARLMFCNNRDCIRASFAEQPGSEIHRYQRRTRCLDVALSRLSAGMTAKYASGQLGSMNVKVSERQILYQQGRTKTPSAENLRAIGVDDWAFRKGQSYGTVIVDHHTGGIVTLLDGREKAGLRGWLDDHPGISIVTRDRSSSYSKAVTEHDADIRQVADRFHLFENLRCAIGEYVTGDYSRISGLLGSVQQESPTTSRSVKFKAVKELQSQGLSKSEVAKRSGVSPSCVSRYWNMEAPACNVRRPAHNYEKYTGRVERMHAAGQPLSKIHSMLTEEGFTASLRCFVQYYRYLSRPRNKDEAPRCARCVGKRTMEHLIFRHGLIQGAQHVSQAQGPSKSEKTGLKFKPLSEAKQKITDTLLKDSRIADICSIVKDFYVSVKMRSLKLFDGVLEKMHGCGIGAIESMARGIGRDMEAVRNAITLPYSNGRVEGHNNKIKVVKRMMFGRGSIDLLLKRLILQRRYAS